MAHEDDPHRPAGPPIPSAKAPGSPGEEPEGDRPAAGDRQGGPFHRRRSGPPPPGAAPPPILNAPPATTWLLVVLLAVFAAVNLLPSNWAEIMVLRLALIPGLFLSAFENLDRPLAWLALATPLTHALVHQDLLHLLINAGLFLAFGTAIERRFGMTKFLGLCAVTALAGAATQMAADWGSFVPMIGASGAVSGLMGAVIRVLAADRTRPESRRLALALMAVLLIGNVLIGAVGGVVFGLPGAIAWQAHLGGLAAGFVMAEFWVRAPRSGARG